ncbi:PRD domain-containing protein [Corynebacterium sp. H128]|uniref:PRD domain-containing protein n=1 Tax=unclassified Corynebacterium TaxID=2624378 RepID=UPI0030AB5E3D
MKVIRALNNNVVLSQKPDGTEVVLTGWGIGFQKRPGDSIDAAEATRIFVPERALDTHRMAGLLAAIPLGYLDMATRALEAVRNQLPVAVSSATIVSLADHLHMAMQRLRLDPSPRANPLAAEVVHLYPTEFAIAGQILAQINQEIEPPLPDSEKVAIALHLVNAGFRTADLTSTFAMTDVFPQLLGIISEAFDLEIDPTGVNAARFITHMRYFFIRAAHGQQLQDGAEALWESLAATQPLVVDCAQKLATILQLRLGTELTKDEIAYLALHIARLVGDRSPGD